MTTYTADDFKHARFAVKGRDTAIREWPATDTVPWDISNGYGWKSDEGMALNGWEPVRSLTADNVSPAELAAMVKRAVSVFITEDWVNPDDAEDSDVLATVTTAIRAAITPTPPRPEGAEDIERSLASLDYLHDETGASRADLATLANDLAALGYRKPDLPF